jgi:hypothetical protein
MRFLPKSPVLPTTPSNYPVGTFVHTEKGFFYIVSPTRRLRIITRRCLESWAPPRVVLTSESAVSKYVIGITKMKFRNGSLIHNLADGKIYLIEEGKRRHVTDPDVLETLGASWKDVTRVSLAEVNLHPEGETL